MTARRTTITVAQPEGTRVIKFRDTLVGPDAESAPFDLCGRPWSVRLEFLTGTITVRLISSPGIVSLAPAPYNTRLEVWDNLDCEGAPKSVFDQHLPTSSSSWAFPTDIAVPSASPLFPVVSVTVRLTIRETSWPFQSAQTFDVSSLLTDLASMLETGEGHDTTIIVETSRFLVHRAILGARSKVMRAMFTKGQFKEGAIEAIVEIGEIEPETMAQVLRFAYTGTVDLLATAATPAPVAGVPPTYDTWAHLLVAADRFDMRDLFVIAQRKISALLTVANSIDSLRLSIRLPGATILKAKSVDFISKNGLPLTDFDMLDGETARELLKKHIPIIPPNPEGSSQTNGGEEERKRKSADGRSPLPSQRKKK